MIVFLPDVPNKAFFLSKEDREKAILRVQENMTGIKNNKIKWPQMREALTDPKAWILVLIQLCSNIPNGGVASVSLVQPPSKQQRALIYSDLVWSHYHPRHGI